MSEAFEFATVWQEIHADGVARDYASTHRFEVYATALDQHRRACEGRWLTPQMSFPHVSELAGVSGGRRRVIRAAQDLWTDERPPLSRAEFTALRERAFGVIDGRMEAA